jgi:hydrogenase maturation protease
VADGGAARAVLVVGIGNTMRRDDAVGLVVARRVRSAGVPPEVEVREEEGEPVGLLDTWAGRDAVVVVDAMRSGAAAGTVHRLDATAAPLPAEIAGSTSTHAVALSEAIELGRALGRLPGRLVVFAIEGGRFDAGDGLTPAVEAAVAGVVDAVVAEACAAQG